MKYAIVGSRDFNDYELMKEILDAYTNIDTIVSGGAKGADSLAHHYAKVNDIYLIEFIPEWDKYGKSAGFKRNKLIIEECDYCIAFWDGKSKGTKSSINLAKKLNKGLRIVKYS